MGEAIGNLQDIVYTNIDEWRKATAKTRGQHAQKMERKAWEESIERGWRMKKKTKGRIEMGRRTCNWKEEDIKAIYVAKWAKKEGKQEEEWEYMIRTMKGDIGWIWEKEMIEYMGNNTKGGWGEEAEKIMEKLRSEHRMKMTAKGRIIGKEKEDDVNKKEEI